MSGPVAGVRRMLAVLTAALLLAACTSVPAPSVPVPGGPASTSADPSAPVAAGSTGALEVAGREFGLAVPAGYDRRRPSGLLVALHGYTGSAAGLADYFGLARAADERGLLLALPDGTTNSRGDRFWNATPACCDFDGSGVDDSGYLSELIDEVSRWYVVDPGLVFVIGHSNGGFMAHRFACEHADQVTGIASLAGPQTSDRAACAPSRPVAALQIHGTADETVAFAGGRSYPSAPETVRRWAELNGCDPSAVKRKARDLDRGLRGAETAVTAHRGCPPGAAAELWKIEEGRHVPELAAGFTGQVLDWLLAHRR